VKQTEKIGAKRKSGEDLIFLYEDAIFYYGTRRAKKAFFISFSCKWTNSPDAKVDRYGTWL